MPALLNTPSIRALLALALGLLPATRGLAQNTFAVEHDGRMRSVVSIRHDAAYVTVAGQLTRSSTSRWGLARADEFLPVFIAVRHLAADTVLKLVAETIVAPKQEFSFTADFEAPCPLDDVYLVLDFESKSGQRHLVPHALGRLVPLHPQHVSLSFPVEPAFADAKFQLHVFVAGSEALHSAMPAALRDAALDRMVRKRIAAARDAGPALLAGPPAEYPPKLLRDRLTGEVRLRFTIRPDGALDDIAVVNSTDPEFSDAAVAAVRQWRFVPTVKAGAPVATTVALPFVFAPPDKS